MPIAAENSMKNFSDSDALACARNVLEREIEGLTALKSSLDEKFVHAVNIIGDIQGRLIVSGMGKSGHIGRKIAATFASTGTPSYFVHPGEASHGDLGMITKDDAVLALSNSGETAELADVISYTRRFSIPLIAMVRRKTSMLVTSADVALILPEIPEASPIAAPTTSTTMMLALGDALAMALLEQRGFTKDDFGVFHPGGKLGKAFVKVSDLMHGPDQLPLVSEATPMQEVLLVMTQKTFGCAGVVSDDQILRGIVTDGDLRRHMQPDLLSQTAGQIMTRDPVTIETDALAAKALGIMNTKNITSIFVLNEGRPVGIIHVHDCLRAGII